MSEKQLLEQFVGSFAKLDSLVTFDAVPPELDGGTDQSDRMGQTWRPIRVDTDAAALELIYRGLPGRFPPLYEQLVLSYRWLDVELDGFIRLLANPPGPTLAALKDNITADPVLTEVLFPLGFIPFGQAPGGSYDPICFDTCRRSEDGDCPILRIEHEAVLCTLQLGGSSQVAPSFRELAEAVVGAANGRTPDSPRQRS